MRASVAPTKEQNERISQAVFQSCIDSMSDNLLTTLLVLHEDFGFGKKRIFDFLEATSRKAKEFKDYQDFDIARDKFLERIRPAGVKRETIYSDASYIAFIRDEKRKNAVSVKDAYEMKSKLDFMKSLM